MKRLATALALLITASGPLMAEPPGGPPPGGGPPGAHLEALSAKLGLDDYQKGELKRILEEQRTKMDAEREQFRASGERPTREAMQAKMQAYDLELKQQLSSVLTAEQLQKFQAMEAERRQHRGPPPGPPPGSPDAQ